MECGDTVCVCFQVCEAPTVIRSSKLQCFDQLIAFTSSFPHMIKEGKMRDSTGMESHFFPSFTNSAKNLYHLGKFFRRELQFLETTSYSWNSCPCIQLSF